MPRNRLVLGQWNVICDRCGFKFKNDELQQEWTGLRVCSKCIEPRHPQTLLKVREESTATPWSRPEPEDIYVDVDYITFDAQGRPITISSEAEAVVTEWETRVNIDGGSVSASTRFAVSLFVQQAMTAGYWSKFHRLNLFCGNNLAACLIPLVAENGVNDINSGFISSNYSESTGLTNSSANGGISNLATGVVAGLDLDANNVHLAVYNRSQYSSNYVGYHIGANQSTTRFQLLAAPGDADHLNIYGVGCKFYAYGFDTAESIIVPSNAAGLTIGNVLAGPAKTVYRNGVSIGTSSVFTTHIAPPNTEIHVFNGGDTSSFVWASLGAYSIGQGFTAGEAALYTTHMQTFQNTLGRAV